MFANTPLYRQINSDAQRQRPPYVTPPALTWHMAFLIPRQKEQTQDAVKAELDNIVETFCSVMRALGEEVRITPQIGNIAILLQKYKKVTQSPKYQIDDLTAADRNEINDQHICTLKGDQRSVTLAFNWHTIPIIVRVQVEVNLFTISIIANIRGLTGPAPRASATGNIYLDNLESLAINFWDNFIAFVESAPDVSKLLDSELFTLVFADLRGIILSTEHLGFQTPPTPPSGKFPKWNADHIDKMYMAVSAKDNHECTVSYMLSRRAICLSSLGAQSFEYPHDKRIPLMFLLCCQDKAINERQLGRLVERMHLIATMRIAALIDLPLLRDAGIGLRQIDSVTSDARAAVEGYAARKTQAADARQKVEKAHQAINTVASDFSTANAAGVGLLFRIESARFYISQFRSHLCGLRLGRVEGYHRYDQFIERRLGTTLEFIDRLGVRFERTSDSIARIDQSLSAIETQETAIKTGQTSGSVEKIQRDGAFWLLAVLVPYYILGAKEHFEDDLDNIGKAFFVPVFFVLFYLALKQQDHPLLPRPEKDYERYSQKVIGISLVALGAFLCYRFLL